MADSITHDSGTKAVASPDGKGQGCTTTKRAYVKPELILLYGNAGAGNTAARGTEKDKGFVAKGEVTNLTNKITYHYSPS